MERTQRSVLVTGATSGIGRATALLLAERGFRVFAGTRRGIERGGKSLGAAEDFNGALTPIELDVTSDAQIGRAAETIAAASPHGLFGLVNNAGLGPPAAVELTGLAEVRELLEVNTLGPLRIIQATLPLLRRGRGRIVNMSSMNGSIALPMVGAYSASKFALEALSDSLRIELRPWGIDVTVIRPGQVSTAIFDKARTALEERSQQLPDAVRGGYLRLYRQAGVFNERGARASTQPETVAYAVLRALNAHRPRACYHVGLDAWGLKLAQSLLPRRVFEAILAHASGAGRRGALLRAPNAIPENRESHSR